MYLLSKSDGSLSNARVSHVCSNPTPSFRWPQMMVEIHPNMSHTHVETLMLALIRPINHRYISSSTSWHLPTSLSIFHYNHWIHLNPNNAPTTLVGRKACHIVSRRRCWFSSFSSSTWCGTGESGRHGFSWWFSWVSSSFTTNNWTLCGYSIIYPRIISHFAIEHGLFILFIVDFAIQFRIIAI